ncbi:MAG: hypothetical protein FJZ95_11280 [Chloroflexi bacterium]|nr:hypothetical protein [Chloroflexota bacterium]
MYINGKAINGFLDESKPCPNCGHAEVYYDLYDSYFCPACNQWLESKCSDPCCSYCKQRPERPLFN